MIFAIMDYVRDVIDDDRITITDVSQSTPATNIADPHSDQYKLIEKTLRQIYGNEIVVAPFFVIGGADAKYFAAKPLGLNTYTVTPLQLESVADMPRLHGVDERIQQTETQENSKIGKQKRYTPEQITRVLKHRSFFRNSRYFPG